MNRQLAALLLAFCLAAAGGCMPPQHYDQPHSHDERQRERHRSEDEQAWDSAEFRADAGRTFKVCERALRRMGITVKERKLRDGSGSILGEDRRNGAEVVVRLRETRENRRTVVKARYGERGDRRFSEHLFGEIDRTL